MPCYCAVPTCKNSFRKTKGQGIIYHCFPSRNDPQSMEICKEWVRRCRRTSSWNPSAKKICSVHFQEHDYERDLEHELLNLPIRRRLKKTAVPSLHLPPVQSEEKNEESNHEEFIIEVVNDEIEDNKKSSDIWKEKYKELLLSYEELQDDMAQMEIRHRNEVKHLKLKIKNYENLLKALKPDSSVLF